MAIDSERKRRAAFSAGRPYFVVSPTIDGSIDSADRAMLASAYPGITVAAPAAGDIIFGMVRVIRTIKTILEPYGSMYEV